MSLADIVEDKQPQNVHGNRAIDKLWRLAEQENIIVIVVKLARYWYVCVNSSMKRNDGHWWDDQTTRPSVRPVDHPASEHGEKSTFQRQLDGLSDDRWVGVGPQSRLTDPGTGDDRRERGPPPLTRPPAGMTYGRIYRGRDTSVITTNTSSSTRRSSCGGWRDKRPAHTIGRSVVIR